MLLPRRAAHFRCELVLGQLQRSGGREEQLGLVRIRGAEPGPPEGDGDVGAHPCCESEQRASAQLTCPHHEHRAVHVGELGIEGSIRALLGDIRVGEDIACAVDKRLPHVAVAHGEHEQRGRREVSEIRNASTEGAKPFRRPGVRRVLVPILRPCHAWALAALVHRVAAEQERDGW